MKNNEPVTKQYFVKRLRNLCLRSGLTGFPADQANQHILFKSMIISLDKARTYTDKEINQKLEYWLNHICPMETVDYITLRRWLVDAGYLTRNREGSCYNVNPLAPAPQYFDDDIEQIDVEEELNNGREEIARKKREYLEIASRA